MFYSLPDDYFYGSRGSYITPREYERYRQQQRLQKAYEQQVIRQRQMAQEQVERERLFRLRQAELARQEQRQQNSQRMAASETRQPRYAVVGGRDGILYRVPIDDDDDDNNEYRIVQDRDGSLIRIRNKHPSTMNSRRNSQTMTNGAGDMSSNDQPNEASKKDNLGETSEDRVVSTTPNSPTTTTRVVVTEGGDRGSDLPAPVAAATAVPPVATTSLKKDKRKSKRITAIVEDVTDDDSDSDSSNDDLKSIWRNRHPTIGESWMEPIEIQ